MGALTSQKTIIFFYDSLFNLFSQKQGLLKMKMTKKVLLKDKIIFILLVQKKNYIYTLMFRVKIFKN